MGSSPDHHNPQEPPAHSSSKKKSRLPTCIFDLFFDLPHPAASTTDKAKIIDPPVTISPSLAEEMSHPDNITRLSRFAFPEYDDTSPDAVQELAALRRENKLLTSRGRTFGAHLTKHDVYHVDFVVHHHTFSLVLADGKTRVHGHVRRYLPTHVDSVSRMDVGRRRPRAMVLLTRAMGGERFYSSVLKTVESITVESEVNSRGYFAKKKDPTRSFLHALFNRHATLITQYAELRRHGLSLNFTQAPTSMQLLEGNSNSACDIAKAVMKENEELFRITLDKLEFGNVGKKNGPNNVSNIQMEEDLVHFYLPFTLQPGFECLPQESLPEDIASPIIPLLRYIGPSHFVRLLSALLCERRIILISKSITRLSMCVRAASSILAQGLLLWKHILIPVVPPHMLRFLSVKAPYLVGILHPYASRLGKIQGLTDVLCVNVDTNELKTLNMANARLTVPDMLKKVRGKSESGPSGAETLARDLDEIVKADQILWSQDAGGNDKPKENNGTKALDTSVSLRADSVSSKPRKQSILEKMKNPMQSFSSKRKASPEEKHVTSVDAAIAFGKMVRSTFQKEAEDDDGAMEDDDTEQLSAPKYAAPSHDTDVGSVEACIVAENEGGEEDVRAALTCFFIHMYGDMGMYLSETHGTFWLDRRKWLLRKKQLGLLESSPIFVVLQKFSSSSMFAIHVKGRIDDMSMTARDRSNIMPHHIPLFDVCSKYLSVHRLDFSLINVRRIVAKTVLACPRHVAVERHVAIRTMALSLTEDAPFDGNTALATTELVNDCHECNTNLSTVMSVIWARLDQRTKTNNMPILLALHLLKNLVSNGPLTAITEALDGAGKIYELKSFSDAKSSEHNREVRQAADHVYGLLVDLLSLFARRRRIAFSKAQQLTAASANQNTWSNYIVGRLPLTMRSQNLHDLFRPITESGRIYYDAGASVAPSLAASNAPSIMALSRLNKSLMESRLEAPSAMYDEDEEDRLFGPGGDQSEYFDESIESRNVPPLPVDEMRASPNTANDTGEVDENIGLSSDVDIAVSALTDAFGYGADMLSSFNYAVSSHGGSCLSVSQSGSHFGGSERSGSPQLNARNAIIDPSMGKINEDRFSPGDQEIEENDDYSYYSNGVEANNRL